MLRVALLAAGLQAVASAPAVADDIEVNSLRVSYGDLDLSSEKDASRLLARINTAAKRVCGDSTARVSLEDRRALRECRVETVEKAVASLNEPVVTAEYIEKTGRRITLAASE